VLKSILFDNSDGGSAACGLVCDNTNDCDQGVLVDIGFLYGDEVGGVGFNSRANSAIACYCNQCHGPRGIAVGEFSGLALDCTAASYCFTGTVSGELWRCHGGESSFGGSGKIFTGKAYDCIGGDKSFGNMTCSGEVYRCLGGDGSFGFFVQFSGIAEDCVCTGDGFLGMYIDSGTDAILRRCRAENRTLPIRKWQGLMTGCTFKNAATNGNAVEITGEARIYNSTLIANGTGKSIYAAAAQDAKIAHCRMNKGIDANVTNLIGTPYNVDDTDVSL